MRIRPIYPLLLGLLALPAPALAQPSDTEATVEGTPTSNVAWRGSSIIYSNVVSTASFDKGMLLDYNPYYAMTLSFRPKYFIRDDLSLSARLDLEGELTDPDELDYRGQWVLYDLLLAASYAPTWAEIPVLGIKAGVNLRLGFPTGIFSQARSRIMSVEPGMTLTRSFDLLSGDWLKSVSLLYGFRYSKYFDQYANPQIQLRGGCRNANQPDCQHDDAMNTSQRISNTFEVGVQLHRRLSFTADFILMSDFRYDLPAGVYTLNNPGAETLQVAVGDAEVSYNALFWGILDVTYDATDWLGLSLSLSTYVPAINSDSTGYNNPFFKKEDTQLSFDIKITLDALVGQVQDWTGWGRGGDA